MAFRKRKRYADPKNLVRDPERHRWGDAQCYWCRCTVYYGVQRHPGIPSNLATRDHLVPRSRGGTNDRQNIVVACYKCNQERGCDVNWRPKPWRIRTLGVT